MVHLDKREKLRSLLDDDDYERFIDIEQRASGDKLMNPLSLTDMKFLFRVLYRILDQK